MNTQDKLVQALSDLVDEIRLYSALPRRKEARQAFAESLKQADEALADAKTNRCDCSDDETETY